MNYYLLIPFVMLLIACFGFIAKNLTLERRATAAEAQLRLWREQREDEQTAMQILSVHRYPRVAKVQRPGGDVEIPAEEFHIELKVKHSTLFLQFDHDDTGSIIDPTLARHLHPGDVLNWRRVLEDAPPEVTWLSLTPSLVPPEATDAAGG